MVKLKQLMAALILSSLSLALSGASLMAQTNPSTKITIKVEIVNVLCTVTDGKGNFITNLTKDDFQIFEDNVPQKMENFSAQGGLPLSISLLIDTSASVAAKLKFEQEAAAEFFFSNIHPEDKALMAEFDTGVTLIQDFTNDPNLLAKQLKALKAAGGTSLYDAIYLVSEEKLQFDTTEKRKTIIIISDGEDTVSKVTFEDALEMAQKAGAVIFAISTNKTAHFGTGLPEEGDTILEQFASATGGKVYYPAKLDDLSLAFREIDRELRSQYSIGYRPINIKRDGSFRRIRVSVKGKDYHLRHRKGYYAPKG